MARDAEARALAELAESDSVAVDGAAELSPHYSHYKFEDAAPPKQERRKLFSRFGRGRNNGNNGGAAPASPTGPEYDEPYSPPSPTARKGPFARFRGRGSQI